MLLASLGKGVEYLLNGNRPALDPPEFLTHPVDPALGRFAHLYRGGHQWLVELTTN